MAEISDMECIKKMKASHNRKKAKSGGFQVMGLSHPVLNGILRKGYKVPTPIQRKTIPLILEGKDVVAMARTGSGKTAAFLVPLFERLQIHSAKAGARALILSPTRELAMQTLSFAKELGRFTNIKAAVILGGDSFNEQFTALHNSPDVIIATPGRFMHLCVEMNLKLDSVEYAVFDEADRLFEMGFYEQLKEITSRLPENRQTLLFSATLPKLLVEFAQAGLSDPQLIRLDVENKISQNLKQTFFLANSEDKVALFIHMVTNVISRKEQTIIFAATRSHVEYLHKLMESLEIPSTCIYSALDSSARKINIAKFRSKKVNFLIVTDIAARGIDIPLLSNVVNFNFPFKPKLFIHRVGRVARAGKSGTAYSIICPDEFPYLLDLHLFLNSELKFASQNDEDWHQVCGKVPQTIIDDNRDYILKKHFNFSELNALAHSMENAQGKYLRTRSLASKESVRRTKELMLEEQIGIHPLFLDQSSTDLDQERISLLDQLKNVRPKCTIFEVKRPGIKKGCQTPAFMKEIRDHDKEKIEKFHTRLKEKKLATQKRRSNKAGKITKEDSSSEAQPSLVSSESNPETKGASKSQDYFLPYTSSDVQEEKGYAVTSSFERESSKVSLDLVGDEGDAFAKPQTKWDRSRKKFVSQPQTKKIKTESGVWISASYKSDIYDKWKAKMNQQDEEEREAISQLDEGDAELSTVTIKDKKRKAPGFVALNVRQEKGHHPLLKGKPQVQGPRADLIPLEKRIKIQKRKQRIRKMDKEREARNKNRRMKRNKQRAKRSIN